jgi:hypothetical protein
MEDTMTTETTDARIVADIDCATNTIIYREMTADEIAAQVEFEAEQAAVMEQREAAKEALTELKASAKAKLVAGTPLTEEEAATIVL